MTEAAAGFLIVNDIGKVLLCRRSPRASGSPNTWATPGGGVEPGESPLDTAFRECWEELGNCPDGRVGDSYVFKRPNFTFTTYVYFINTSDFPRTLNYEHTAARWYTLQEALDLPDLHPGCRESFAKLNQNFDFRIERYSGISITEILPFTK